MTAEIAIVLSILLAAVILFITEKVRVDVVALMVLVALALTNLITPAEACQDSLIWPSSLFGRC